MFDAEAIAQRWKEEFKREGMFIPYGADFRSDLPLKGSLEPQSYVLYVARFVPENSIAEFLDAAQELATEIDVVIVGSSGYGGEFDRRASVLAESNPRVHWLGHVNDDDRLHSLWQHAAAYFHGHSVGGTNPALVQAMALGAPVVARDTVYNREVLAQYGLFVEPTGPAIATAVRQLASDPILRNELRVGGKARAAGVYTWEKVNSSYQTAARELVQSSRSGRTSS